ncbi:MAG: Hsp70 family protein [Alphaproteobacteria bacterium]
MNGALCPQCAAWRRAEGERFCGNCGHCFIALNAESVSPRIVYAGSAAADAHTLTVEIVNEGTVPAGGSLITVLDDTGREVTLPETIQDGMLDLKGERAKIRLQLPAGLVRDGRPWHGTIVHRVSGSDRQRRLAEIDLGRPVPDLTLAHTQLTVDPPPYDGPPMVTLCLEQSTVNRVDVARISFEQDANDTGADGLLLPVPEAFGTDGHQVRLQLPPGVIKQLLDSPGGRQYRLVVDLVDHTRPIVLRFHLRMTGPAQPVAHLQARVPALSGKGRRARLALTFSNLGGEPCRLKRVRVEIRVAGGGFVAMPEEEMGEGAGRVLLPGATLPCVLRIPLDSEAAKLQPGVLYPARVVASFSDPELPDLIRYFELDVRAAAPFRGQVFVDLGTVATAVAVVPPRDRGFGTGVQVLKLGLQDHFVPTAVAYLYNPQTADMETVIGEEARQYAEAPSGTDVSYFDGLKWQLTNPQILAMPDGSTLTRLDMVVHYLKALRREIEESPEVAAEVSAVYPTCPARFSTPERVALFDAFRRAGLEPQRVVDAQGAALELSESWSPLIVTLPLPDLETAQEALVGVTAERLLQGAAKSCVVLTYDVGGGSTDLSVFRLRMTPDGDVEVVEKATDGDQTFGGNGISRWLFERIRPSLEAALKRQGVVITDLPIHPPWDPISIHGTTPLAVRNGAAIGRLIWDLQRSDGVLEGMRYAPALEPGDVTALDVDQPAVAAWLQQRANQVAMLRPLNGEPLVLRTTGGREAVLTWDAEGLSFDVAEAFHDLATSLGRPMQDRLERLAVQAKVTAEDDTFVLVTGRGSRFPLLGVMIPAHLKRVWPSAKLNEVRIDAGELKTITSRGAAAITHILNESPDILTYRSDCAPILGVLGERDRTGSRRQRVLSLRQGFPTPGDGYIGVPRPLPAGTRVRVVTLVLSRGEPPLFDERLHEIIATAQEVVPLNEDQGRAAHIILHAPAQNQLQLSIGWPRTEGGSDTPIGPDTWEIVPLGPPTVLCGTVTEEEAVR